MRMHAWVVCSSIKKPRQFMPIYKYSQEKQSYGVWVVFFMQFFYIQIIVIILVSKIPLVIYRKFLYFLISI